MSEDEDKLEDLKSKDKDLEIQGQGFQVLKLILILRHQSLVLLPRL